ncbi:bifunctional adenosylcobinamide kinase/adenosylcobinamide-phosphate guanylyltransferase [Geomonas paludis]|uniref:Adenosylcobinamide kinase n=1 Tax=Geomonas paludis TaxID=2740185 RepID=A0A6V8MZU2_9BACT|nr:bifunctional adenosylcobinamide kinase/adenosylcobinamide-phosphate guanylyltransferase [Geomonas paludis]UPU36416.1 bifunctional adenosylcobinamide kinase/adenosylcobinamide-phosphate guanylyltransferase [Geomonas paludis]GFO65758.1 adenosylcobinamide kinase/adenosylcobinamide phosphate guanyltransferase [Geomonas paludis]
MSKVVLVTGGARSGKSRFAEGLADKYAPLRGYLATGEAGDAEMADRIARHQGRRGPEWQTVEEPLKVAEAIRSHQGRFNVMLMDCVTLWISNLLFRCPGGAAEALAEVKSFAGGFSSLATPLIIVTNEVGMGIVPEHPLSRAFRDLAGEANEIIAAAADEVYVTISGLPLRLK